MHRVKKVTEQMMEIALSSVTRECARRWVWFSSSQGFPDSFSLYGSSEDTNLEHE